MNCLRNYGCEYYAEDSTWKRDCCFLCGNQSECAKVPLPVNIFGDAKLCKSVKRYNRCRREHDPRTV